MELWYSSRCFVVLKLKIVFKLIVFYSLKTEDIVMLELRAQSFLHIELR